MQTITILIVLTALILFTVHQHLALKKLYKATQERNNRQDTINSAFSAEIRRLKANAKQKEAAGPPELPYFLNQPRTQYFMEVNNHAN